MPLRPSGESKESTLEELKQRIHGTLVDKLDLTKVGELEGEILRREIRLVVEHLCDSEDTLLNRAEREQLVTEVLDETFGLGPLELLLKDSTISDIMINGPKNIYCERRGNQHCLGALPKTRFVHVTSNLNSTGHRQPGGPLASIVWTQQFGSGCCRRVGIEGPCDWGWRGPATK